jgi:hypothetical protein
MVVLGVFYFAPTVIIDRVWYEVDALTYFNLTGLGVCFLGAAWWKLAEWRRGANPQHQWQTELRRRIRKHGGEPR